MHGRYLIVILVIAGALVTALAMKSAAPFAWPGNDDATRIKFSHSYHIAEVGVACEDCHAAKTSTSASDNLRPGHDNCQACHEEQLADKCGTCHVDPRTSVPHRLPCGRSSSPTSSMWGRRSWSAPRAMPVSRRRNTPGRAHALDGDLQHLPQRPAGDE